VILYILLCGLPPFWGENEKAIFDAILVGKVDFSEDPWPKISAPAKDLVTKLLAKDVRARLTVEQALKHPWVADADSAPDAPLDSAVLSRMRTFANQSKFKQLARGARTRLRACTPAHLCTCAPALCARAHAACARSAAPAAAAAQGMLMLVKHLKKEELEGLRKLFVEMDVDKSGTQAHAHTHAHAHAYHTLCVLTHLADARCAHAALLGTITIDELRSGLDQHGAHLAKSEVEALMNNMDLDGSHALSYDEFMAATVHMQKLESEDNLLQAFADFDTDGSGSISAEELAVKLVELGIKNSREEVMEIIKEVDTNNDGTVDYAEFVQLMCPRLLGHCAAETQVATRAMKMKGAM
jgi:calcium-dependent protein kinase